METASTIFAWTYHAIATWYVAGIVGGALILVAERLSRRREPSNADVQKAAERYRQCYGDQALTVIGDHILAASFAPDSRHKRFLRRVTDELLASTVTNEDRRQAIEHSSGRRARCRLSPQVGVGGDGALAEHDLVDAPRRHADRAR